MSIKISYTKKELEDIINIALQSEAAFVMYHAQFKTLISKKARLSRISNVKDWVSFLDQWTLNCLKDILGCSDSTVQSIMDCVKDTTIETNFRFF